MGLPVGGPATWVPLGVSPGSVSRSITPIYATTNLRYNLTTVRPTTGPGAPQRALPQFFKKQKNKNKKQKQKHRRCLRTVYGITVTIYNLHRSRLYTHFQANINVSNL